MRTIKIIIRQNELCVIKLVDTEVSIIPHLGESWFITIANSLEIINSRKVLISLNDNERNTVTLSYKNGDIPNYVIVPESVFYKLITRSRKATQQSTFAYQFSNWVFSKVFFQFVKLVLMVLLGFLD